MGTPFFDQLASLKSQFVPFTYSQNMTVESEGSNFIWMLSVKAVKLNFYWILLLVTIMAGPQVWAFTLKLINSINNNKNKLIRFMRK